MLGLMMVLVIRCEKKITPTIRKKRLTYYYRYIYANNEVWQYHFNYPNDSVTQITTMLPDGSSGNAYTFTYNLQKRNDFQPTFVGNWFDSCP